MFEQLRRYWTINLLYRNTNTTSSDKALAVQAMGLLAKTVHPLISLRYRSILNEQSGSR